MALNENVKFDSFTPFQQLKFIPIELLSDKALFFDQGTLVKEIENSIRIYFNPSVSKITNNEVLKCTIEGTELDNIIESNFEFDLGFTNSDRFMFVTIPGNSNIDCVGMAGLKAIVGNTRNEKYFKAKEPYCVSMFFTDQRLFKVAFSFCNPDRVFELYNTQRNNKSSTSTSLEQIIIYYIIENFDSDGAIVTNNEIIEFVKNNFSVDLTQNEVDRVVENINSYFPGTIKKTKSFNIFRSGEVLYEAKVSKSVLQGILAKV